jgi:hypothetical protein
MNSKDNNRKLVVCQFITLAALFIAYFVICFILELEFLKNIRKSYYHMKLITERPNIVKYTVVFTIEELSETTPYMYKSKSSKTK